MSNEFADALKERLEERAISNSELARRLGVGERTVSYYLAGKRQPKVDALPVIAAAIGIEVKDFFDRGPRVATTSSGRVAPVLGFASCSAAGWGRPSDSLHKPQPVPPEIDDGTSFWVVAAGHSMRPEGIASGDYCLVSEARPPSVGDRVWVVDPTGSASIKRLIAETDDAMSFRGWQEPEGSRQTVFGEKRSRSMIARAAPVVAVLDGVPSSNPPPRLRLDPRQTEFEARDDALASRIAGALGLDRAASEEDILDAISRLKPGKELSEQMRGLSKKLDTIASWIEGKNR